MPPLPSGQPGNGNAVAGDQLTGVVLDASASRDASPNGDRDLEAGAVPATVFGLSPLPVVVRSSSNGQSSSRQERQEARGAGGFFRNCLRRSRRPPQVRYPRKFKLLVLVVCVASVLWVVNYLTSVLPTIDAHTDVACQYNDSQLTYNAKMLFVYFLWFAMARLSLFLPGIAHRIAMVQSRTHGFCRTYCVHLVLRDGPLYIFAVGSMLFWFHLMQSSTCEERSPELYSSLKLYAIYSCLLSIVCLMLTYWHNKLIIETVREVPYVERRAPAGTLEKLESVRYDAEVFGDESGKLYPAECAICLATWEADDSIKVTRCKHAFHAECIGHWLETARTCALCRQDLTKSAESDRAAQSPNQSSTVGAQQPGLRSPDSSQTLES